MFCRFFAGFVLALFCCPDGFGQDTPKQIFVSAENVYVNGLLVQSGNILGTSIVVGGYSKDRITISGRYSSGQDFLKKVAEKIGAHKFTLNGIQVFAGSCAGSPTGSTFKPFGEKGATLNFNGLEPTEILNILRYVELGNESNYDYFSKQDFGLVGIYVKNATLSSIYEGLLLASGVKVEKEPSGKLVASRRSDCKPEVLASHEALLPQLIANDCPRRNGPRDGVSAERCGPLEFYKLENIILRGRISIGSKTFALAETADGITWLLKPGDYVGHDYGKIVAITDRAVTVRETVKNPYDYYYEQTIEIDFRNTRRLLLN
jgi:hypothetical protein